MARLTFTTVTRRAELDTLPASATATAPAASVSAPVLIRPGTRFDQSTVRRIECACFGWERFLFGLWPRVGRPGTTVWLSDVGGVAGGYLLAYPHELSGMQLTYIGGVGVLPHYRKRGLGTLLTQAVLARSFPVWLHVRAGNVAAIALYRKLGMHELQRIVRFYSNGEDALVMISEP